MESLESDTDEKRASLQKHVILMRFIFLNAISVNYKFAKISTRLYNSNKVE